MDATTLPTTAPVALSVTRPLYDAEGDVLVQVKHAFEHAGLSQTILETGPGGWLLFAVSVYATPAWLFLFGAPTIRSS